MVELLLLTALLLPLVVSGLVAVLGQWPNLRDGVMVAVAALLLPVVVQLAVCYASSLKPNV